MYNNIIKISYKGARFTVRTIRRHLSLIYTKYLFKVNDVEYGNGFKCNGVPIIDINKGCKLSIGSSFKINNGVHFNQIGRQQPCFFIADHGGIISIGDNVGMSSTAIVCHKEIRIGNNVRIGGNTVIYDTDFHNLDNNKRIAIQEDISTVGKKAVIIEDDVFIGAHSIILKGVTIGHSSIIGAGSIVTKSIPANQIWAGNPAHFIKFNDVSTHTDLKHYQEKQNTFA